MQIIYRFFIELTNRKWTSELLAKFAKSQKSRFLISSFAKVYKINQVEMAKPLHEYYSLHEFFIRQLKEGMRPIDRQEDAVVSPVDAIIEEIGTITPDKEIVVKGKRYSIAEMLGSIERAEKYTDGTYIVFYLSPGHYHRIHCPASGTVTGQWSLGTLSYPVNQYGLKFGKSPLSKNYRTITEVRIANHSLAIVKVGAMFVNSIEVHKMSEKVEKGAEMAYFTFGSTVILLFEKGLFEPAPMNLPYEVRVGECIGMIKS